MSILCSMVGATFTVAAAAEIIRAKKGIVAIGNAQVDTAQSRFGGASALFDGTDDYLIANGDFSQSGDFTLEFWFRASRVTGAQILATIGSEATGRAAVFLDGSTLKYDTFSGGTPDITCSGTIVINTWYHIAVVRSGSTITIYRDGSSVGSGSSSGTVGNTTNCYFGADSNSVSDYQGWLDEIRVSNTARYTANFTAPTAPFVNDNNTLLLIHADGTDASTVFEDDNGVRAQKSLVAIGNAQVDTAQSQFGGGSLLLDGTGDYLLSENNGNYNFGTSSFTIEFWIRFNVAPTLYVPIALRPGGAIENGEWWCEITNAEKRMYWGFKNQAGTQFYVNLALAGSNFVTGQWYHIALVNNSGTAQMYVNGTATGNTTALSGSFGNSASPLWVGAGAGSYSLNGWLDEIRISNTARYTANFTPATQPFVNDNNTVLLIHADGTDASTVFRDDNGATPTTYTSDVVTFDGTGDYYEATSLSSSVTADSKYALVCLNLYWAGGNNLQHPFNIRLGTGSGDYGFWIWINGGRSQLKFVTGNGSVPGSIYENTENSLTANAWNQIVMWIDTTSSTTSQIWVNGNQKAYSNDGFPTGSLFNWTNTATTVKVGQRNSSQTGDGSDFNGRISQVYLSAASSFPGIEFFWDKSTNRPKDLGTDGRATGLATPLIYHYGDASTFPTNRGNFVSYSLTANGNVATNTSNTIYARTRRQLGIQAIGNAQVDTAQSKFGGASLLCDGTGDYLRSPLDAIGTGDFTVEFWIRRNRTGTQEIIWDARTNAPAIYIRGDNNYIVYIKSADHITSTTALSSTLTWYHIAVVRSSGITKLYVNGTKEGSDYTDNNNYTASTSFIGIGFDAATSAFQGWIDEFRISNNARYTSNFTPSTTPFSNDTNTLLLLHMDGTDGSTVFIDDNGQVPQTP